MILARRLVAQRCLYGVDRNPVAVDLAKMSLWLVTLAREHPLTFLDHALRHGDSLVGLTRRQIETFHWKPGAPGLRGDPDRRHVERVAELRARDPSRPARTCSDWALRDMWDEAQHELDQVRLFGDLVVAAFFAGVEAGRARDEARASSPTPSRTATREQYRPMARGAARRPTAARAVPLGDRVPGGVRPRATRVRRDRRQPAVRWQEHVSARPRHGYSRLARRSCTPEPRQRRPGRPLLPPRVRASRGRTATFGLIATNTIGQGDTRVDRAALDLQPRRRDLRAPASGSNGRGRRRSWSASCTSSRASSSGSGCSTAAGRHDHRVPVPRRRRRDPARLAANAGKSFMAAYVLGMGFTFDDTDTKGVATPIAEMRAADRRRPAERAR